MRLGGSDPGFHQRAAILERVIDLDDGVKLNYLKFGAALKKITGLDAMEEDCA